MVIFRYIDGVCNVCVWGGVGGLLFTYTSKNKMNHNHTSIIF